MTEIRKVISIGSNCIVADVAHFAGIRIPGPVDNFSSFNIWKAHLLFERKLSKSLFHEDYDVRPSTVYEKETYFYAENVYVFNHNYYIVHNDFKNNNFQKALKKRLKLFNDYYQLSQREPSLWYMYSLEFDDDKIDEEFMNIIINSLPECCVNRLLCIAMRGKNKLFEKYFKYYVEFEEKDYEWHSKKQSLKILQLFEKKYGLKFVTEG